MMLPPQISPVSDGLFVAVDSSLKIASGTSIIISFPLVAKMALIDFSKSGFRPESHKNLKSIVSSRASILSAINDDKQRIRYLLSIPLFPSPLLSSS